MENYEVDPKATLENEYNVGREEFDIMHYFIGIAIFLIGLWMSGNCDWGKKPVDTRPKDDRETPFTLEDLSKFDGKQKHEGEGEPPVYVGVNGFVFDVSESPNYRPGAAYEAFGGKDASIAMAYYSTDLKHFQMDRPYDRERGDIVLRVGEE